MFFFTEVGGVGKQKTMKPTWMVENMVKVRRADNYTLADITQTMAAALVPSEKVFFPIETDIVPA